MSGDLERKLETAVLSDMPLEDVVSLLRQYKALGVEQEEVYSFLASLRKRVADEALEDRILEIADFVSGFCSPHMKVWEQ